MNLADLLELQDNDATFDIEYSDGILTIEVSDSNQEYVINRHSANQKIWYSSPISGADYFSFDEESSKWLNSKREQLEEKLLAELKTFKK